jgi:hypothetical protein
MQSQTVHGELSIDVDIVPCRPTEDSTDRTAGAVEERGSAHADADTLIRSTSYTAAMGQPAAAPVPAHTAVIFAQTHLLFN